MVGLLIKWVVWILGGLVGNFVASVYVIRGEHEGDNAGFIDVDYSSPYGKDDMARVFLILAGAKGANMILSKVRGGGK